MNCPIANRVSRMECNPAELELALHCVDFTTAMHRAYLTGDTAELGRLVAAEMHNQIAARADSLAHEEAA